MLSSFLLLSLPLTKKKVDNKKKIIQFGTILIHYLPKYTETRVYSSLEGSAYNGDKKQVNLGGW